MDIIYDIETYPNCFTLAAEHASYPITWSFEISDYRNDSSDIINWIHWINQSKGRMISFNGVGFDYPVLHTLIKMGNGDAKSLYEKAMAIIQSQDDDRFTHMVYPSDRACEQIDLFKIHHFDNKARATGLKALEFNMRLDSIEDLPFPVGTVLNQEQLRVLKKYNAHDVTATKLFYHQSLEMIRFREELTTKYSRDFMNHNDTKIGKDYFTMELEKAGVQCYRYGKDGRQPVQTPRPVIHLREAILPWIKFERPEFQRVLDWLRGQSITETKGVFKDLTATLSGFDFVFGLGGIHGSVVNEVFESDNDVVILDLDVTSYYPSLAIHNNFRPAHLGETFCRVYDDLKTQRVNFSKGTAENAMLKLALNGVYGDSNNKFSIFYDPLFTMSITLNGQLLLCLLAEQLVKMDGLSLIQINTDGLTVQVKRSDLDRVNQVRQWWEQASGMQLEEVTYTKMIVADVNSYIAVGTDGKVKRKGRYEYELGWHQDASCLVVPKVAEMVLTQGAPIRETVENWPDKMDFMMRIKVPRSSRLELMVEGDIELIQNTTRYYIALDGGTLTKIMPPMEGKTEWRRFAVRKGWQVCVCNRIEDALLDIDFDWYVNEVEKLCLGMQ